MTTTDDTLATTFEPMACMDCRREGLTVEQCAAMIHAEQMLKIALAERSIERAETPAETVLLAQTKAAALAVNRRLDYLRKRGARVAIIDRHGLPVAMIDAHDPRLQRSLESAELVPTSEPHVFQVA